jgi:hypothetical protein
VPFDRDNPLRVQAEAVGEAPTLWAWAIYRGANRFLIARSRPEYRERADALAAGVKAAETVGHRLKVEIVLEEAT